MATTRRDINSSKAYAAPLFWVVVLLVSYWLLAEWQELPKLISQFRADLHWPV